ncbi:MAG: hypothetical protein IT382_18005 [Deltaproteobacteria bacterium]|nr:hypothetical protein [Deltaproteobacteria bacterium]
MDVYEYQEIEIINTYYGEIEHAAIFVRSANLLPGGRFVLPLFRDLSFDTSTAPPTDTRLFVVSYSQYFPGETDESLALSLSYVRTLRELLNVSPTAALESVGG